MTMANSCCFVATQLIVLLFLITACRDTNARKDIGELKRSFMKDQLGEQPLTTKTFEISPAKTEYHGVEEFEAELNPFAENNQEEELLFSIDFQPPPNGPFVVYNDQLINPSTENNEEEESMSDNFQLPENNKKEKELSSSSMDFNPPPPVFYSMLNPSTEKNDEEEDLFSENFQPPPPDA